jgi:hypothetical protein
MKRSSPAFSRRKKVHLCHWPQTKQNIRLQKLNKGYSFNLVKIKNII